jgi:SAM-dependent methyltransferase
VIIPVSRTAANPCQHWFYESFVPPSSVMRLVDDRARGRSFGAVAEDYHRARPSYPAQAVRWLAGSNPVDVVDLGAGTGKLTALLLAESHRVVAVEPDESLLAKLRSVLPGTEALQGTAEAIPVSDRSADVVLVGQAFHWFDPEPALAEIARVLRPHGRLGLLWNFRDDSQAWMRELAAMLGKDGLPDGWTRTFEELPRVASVTRRDCRLAHPVTRDTLVALVSSWSTVATRTPHDREQILDRVRDLWDRHPDLGRDSATMTYRTEAYRVTGPTE